MRVELALDVLERVQPVGDGPVEIHGSDPGRNVRSGTICQPQKNICRLIIIGARPSPPRRSQRTAERGSLGDRGSSPARVTFRPLEAPHWGSSAEVLLEAQVQEEGLTGLEPWELEPLVAS